MTKLFFVGLLCALTCAFLIGCENRSATEDSDEGEASGDIEADNEKWLDTEVEVEPAGSLHIIATGTVRLNSNGVAVHPDGSEIDTECGDDCPMPNAPSGALVGQINLSSTKFLVGAEYVQEIDDGGVLYLIVNDDSYDDNEGSFTVEIFYTAPEVSGDDDVNDDTD